MTFSSTWKSITVLVALLQLTPSASKDFIYNWVVPDRNNPYKNEIARVGDKVVFSWDRNLFHNVFSHPMGGCNKRGRIIIGTEATGTEYIFQESDVGTMTLACDVLQHCAFGQIIRFTVLSTEPSSQPSDLPSMVPSVSGMPSSPPSPLPSAVPSLSLLPSAVPSLSLLPSEAPTNIPTKMPSRSPSTTPTKDKEHDHNENIIDDGKEEESGVSDLNVRFAFAMIMAIVSITI